MKTDFSHSYLVLPKIRTKIPGEKLKEAENIVHQKEKNQVKSMRSFSGFIVDLKHEETKKMLEASGFTVIKNQDVNSFISQRHLTYQEEDSISAATIADTINSAAQSSVDSSSEVKDKILKVMSRTRLINSVYVNTPTIGKGVTVAIIDSGVAPHPDLENKIVASVDFISGKTTPYDDMGHGTHVAGIVAGTGKLSNGKYRGVAPGANIAALKVLGASQDISIADVADNIISALDWCIQNKNKFNIKAVNISLGLPIKGITKNRGEENALLYDPFIDAVNRTVDAGLAVVVSAGNDGNEGDGSIDNEPCMHPRVITVGALDDKNTLSAEDDELAPFSSQGPTPLGLVKPDVIAPGAKIMSLNAAGSFFDEHNKMIPMLREQIATANDKELMESVKELVFAGQVPAEILNMPIDKIRKILLDNLKQDPTDGPMVNGSPAYIALDGTSMSSPYVAGVVADMAEANPSLTPEQIKNILMNTAVKIPQGIGGGENQQGKGVVDPVAAINAANTTHEITTLKEISPKEQAA